MNKNRGDKLINDLKIAKKKIFSAVASCTYISKGRSTVSATHIPIVSLSISHKKVFLLRFHELHVRVCVCVIVMLLYKGTWIRMLGCIK